MIKGETLTSFLAYIIIIVDTSHNDYLPKYNIMVI